MVLFVKCDICEAFVEEGHGYICKCTFTDEVCAGCAGSGKNRCGICDSYFQHASSRRKPKK